jgi:hypothetical protein
LSRVRRRDILSTDKCYEPRLEIEEIHINNEAYGRSWSSRECKVARMAV